jgi:hypothetical protein
VSTFALGFVAQLDARSRMHNRRLADDQTIPMQLGNVTARIGQGNFIDFVGIEPNLALTAFQDGGRQAFLQFE